MTLTEPKVYLIGKTEYIPGGVVDWLKDIGCSNLFVHNLIYYDETLVELAARRCYKSFEVGLNPNITKIREDRKEYIKNILESGHGSVLEHVNATFAFEFVSRVFTHELVRHRAGCAYSQESLRYVRLTNIGFQIPPEIEDIEEAKEIFEETVKYLENQQAKLANIFDITNESFKEKKVLTSSFRRILPIGLSTGIVATFNLRTLRHIIAMRTSQAAEQEIRGVFNKVGYIAKETWPNCFQDMYRENNSWKFENEKV